MTAGWPTGCLPATRGSSPPLGSWNVHFTLCSQMGAIFKGAAWRQQCGIQTTIVGYPWLNPIKTTIETLRFWRADAGIYWTCGHPIKPHKCPGFITSATCHLESLPPPSLPSGYHGQFSDFSQGPPRVQRLVRPQKLYQILFLFIACTSPCALKNVFEIYLN